MKNSKARNFKVEGPYSNKDLDKMFPQSPASANASVEALLEDRLAGGWEPIQADDDANGHWRFVFRAIAGA